MSTKTRKEDSFRSLAPIGRLGAGVNYNFNEHIGVYGQPVLQYHLMPVNDSAQTQGQPWQLTLELGVRIFVDPRQVCIKLLEPLCGEPERSPHSG